jgi:hypothetical protein
MNSLEKVYQSLNMVEHPRRRKQQCPFIQKILHCEALAAEPREWMDRSQLQALALRPVHTIILKVQRH